MITASATSATVSATAATVSKFSHPLQRALVAKSTEQIVKCHTIFRNENPIYFTRHFHMWFPIL